METETLISIGLNFGVPLVLLGVAMFAGGLIERRHFREIREREERLLALPALTTRTWDLTRPVADARLASGAVVVSADYFRSFLAGLRNIIGGRVRSFESLLDRGRREAILRMKESAVGADLIVNVRIETSTIGTHQPSAKAQMGRVEIFAYGTAIRFADHA